MSEDHQTHNAMALVKEKAAVMIKDNEAVEQLIPTALRVISDNQKLSDLSVNILKLAQLDSAERIADEIIKLIKE